MGERYLVIDTRTGTPVCNLSGYKTLKGADEGRKSISSPLLREGLDYVDRVLCIPPGGAFRGALFQYIDSVSKIVCVSKITWTCDTGETVELNLKEGD